MISKINHDDIYVFLGRANELAETWRLRPLLASHALDLQRVSQNAAGSTVPTTTLLSCDRFQPAGFTGWHAVISRVFSSCCVQKPSWFGRAGTVFSVDWIRYILTSFSVLDMPVRVAAHASPRSILRWRLPLYSADYDSLGQSRVKCTRSHRQLDSDLE